MRGEILDIRNNSRPHYIGIEKERKKKKKKNMSCFGVNDFAGCSVPSGNLKKGEREESV